MRRCRAAAAAQDSGTGSDEGACPQGELGGVHVVDGPAAQCLRKPRVGFGDKRDLCVGLHGLDEANHVVGSRGAVAAHGIGAQGLERYEGRQRVGSVERPAVALEGHGDHREEIAGLLHGNQRRPGLLDVHHRFDDEAIHAALEEPQDLFLEDRHGLLEIDFPERLDEMPRGADVAGNQGLSPQGLPRDERKPAVHGPGVGLAVLPELESVGPEGAGVDHVGARTGVIAVDASDHLRVLDAPQLRADPGGHPSFLELRACCPVEDKRPFLHDVQEFSLSLCHRLFPQPIVSIPATAVTDFSGARMYCSVSSTPNRPRSSRS